MVYVILAILVVVVAGVYLLGRRKSAKRGYSYVPDTEALGDKVYNPREIPNVTLATPEFKTEEIAHDEFESDVSDDLLDPRNPHHTAWVKEHPEMETDDEWVQEHPEDNPS